jgi:Ca-activated chloride channel family protein
MQRLPFLAAGFLCVTAAAQQVQPQPISVGIVFDTSGSMGAKLGYSRQLVGQFLKTARPEDEFLLIQFSDRPVLAAGFGANTDEVQRGLAFVQSRGRSALFDAIYLAVDEMRRATN